MSLQICSLCHEHFLKSEPKCPHCSNSSNGHILKIALLLGITQAGCFPIIAPKYGVPASHIPPAEWTVPPKNLLCTKDKYNIGVEREMNQKLLDQVYRVLEQSYLENGLETPKNLSKQVLKITKNLIVDTLKIRTKEDQWYRCLLQRNFVQEFKHANFLKPNVRETAIRIAQKGFVESLPREE